MSSLNLPTYPQTPPYLYGLQMKTIQIYVQNYYDKHK